MIHQFAELGGFYRESEGIDTSEEDRLAQFVQDPAQKFRTRTVLLLVFSGKGFERVEVEDLLTRVKRRAQISETPAAAAAGYFCENDQKCRTSSHCSVNPKRLTAVPFNFHKESVYA